MGPKKLYLMTLNDASMDYAIKCDSRNQLYNYLDMIVKTHTKGLKSFRELLNTLQTEATAGLSEEESCKTVFKDKSNIPLYFINLILNEYYLKVKEW